MMKLKDSNENILEMEQLATEEDTAGVPVHGQGGSIMSAVFNFTNSIVGAGLIGLPYAVKEAGFYGGILLMCFIALLVDWTVRLLVKTSKYTARKSYQDVMEFTFGRRGLVVISVCQFIFAFGAMAAYAVIVGDVLPPVLRAFVGETSNGLVEFLLSRRFLTAFTIIGICFPLCLLRDLSKLANTSALALVALSMIICCIVFAGPLEPEELRDLNPPLNFIRPGSIIRAVGVMSFAFVCQHNSFMIFSSLNKPTLDRWSVVTHLSVALSLVLSLLAAISGYLIYGTKTQANILNNFDTNNSFITISRILLALNMLTTFPLENFVCREVVETFLFGNEHVSFKFNFVLTTIIAGAALIVSLSTCNLGSVMELTGSIAASALAYIIPPLLYIYLSPQPFVYNQYENLESSQVSKSQVWDIIRHGKLSQLNKTKLACVGCIVFGVTVMIVSSGTVIYDYFHPSDQKIKQCAWN